jgi:signal transduction histidine kinase
VPLSGGAKDLARISTAIKDKLHHRPGCVGLPQQQTEQIFNAFFTTKPHGTSHQTLHRRITWWRLWAADNSPRGASFHFTLPTKAEAPE